MSADPVVIPDTLQSTVKSSQEILTERESCFLSRKGETYASLAAYRRSILVRFLGFSIFRHPKTLRLTEHLSFSIDTALSDATEVSIVS